MNENNSGVSYYDGYTKFTVPKVRDNQYNPMIVGDREELFNNILDSIDKKQTSPKYDDLFYVEGKNIDVGGGVEYRGMLSHSDDDYTKVNILCELQDKKTGNVLKSFEKDLIIDYSDFMDSYGIESDIEDYILDELEKYMVGVLEQYDSKYKKENKIMRKETLRFGTTIKAGKWLRLVNDCVNIDSEPEARSFFRDVEKTAKDLGFVLSDGREFSARDAVHDWKIVEKKVDEWVEDLIRENGEDVDYLPNIGLIYRNYGDRLVLGIHDGVGGFDEMSEWEFVNKK